MQKIKEFIENYVSRFSDQFDLDQGFSTEHMNQFKDAGLFGLYLPKSNRGLGFDEIQLGEVFQSLGAASMSLVSILTVHTMVAYTLLRWGNSEMQALLSELATGKKVAAFALSEPAAGSDIANIELQAKEIEGGYALTGRKKWISAALIADIALVFAQSREGPLAFLVPMNLPGIRVTPIKNMMGFRAAMLGEIEFDSVKVNESQTIAFPGAALDYIAAYALDLGRYMIAQASFGLSKRIFEFGIAYAKRRNVFGKKLIEHEIWQHKLTKLKAELQGVKLQCQHTAHVRQQKLVESMHETLLAKYMASNLAENMTSTILKLTGAYGLSAESPIQRCFRDARVTTLIESSSELIEILLIKETEVEYA